MWWDVLLPLWMARLSADTALVTLLGGDHIYPADAAKKVRIPSVQYLANSDRDRESFNVIDVQLDFWAKGTKQAGEIERRLRLLSHRDVGQQLGEYRVFLRYLDGRTLPYPAEPGVVHKQLDFTLELIRQQYAPTTEDS